MRKRGMVFKPVVSKANLLVVLFLALFSISIAQAALAAVTLDLSNPSTGNPADQDVITVSPGSTVTINIRLTSGTDQVAGTANDIGYRI